MDASNLAMVSLHAYCMENGYSPHPRYQSWTGRLGRLVLPLVCRASCVEEAQQEKPGEHNDSNHERQRLHFGSTSYLLTLCCVIQMREVMNEAEGQAEQRSRGSPKVGAQQ